VSCWFVRLTSVKEPAVLQLIVFA